MFQRDYRKQQQKAILLLQQMHPSELLRLMLQINPNPRFSDN